MLSQIQCTSSTSYSSIQLVLQKEEVDITSISVNLMGSEKHESSKKMWVYETSLYFLAIAFTTKTFSFRIFFLTSKLSFFWYLLKLKFSHVMPLNTLVYSHEFVDFDLLVVENLTQEVERRDTNNISPTSALTLNDA